MRVNFAPPAATRTRHSSESNQLKPPHTEAGKELTRIDLVHPTPDPTVVGVLLANVFGVCGSIEKSVDPFDRFASVQRESLDGRIAGCLDLVGAVDKLLLPLPVGLAVVGNFGS